MASELAAALAKVQAELPHIAKNKTGKVEGVSKTTGKQFSYEYKYADLEDVSAAILPLLGKHGLAFTAWPTLDDGRFVLSYTLTHESGEERSGIYPLPGQGKPQDVGGVITYARRYCLSAVTGVAPGDEDNDAAGAAEMQMDRQPAAQANGGDPWQDQPPGQFGEPYEPEKRPTTPLDGRQRSQIFAKFRVLGIADADKQRAVLSDILGRGVSSRKGLSRMDADKVLEDLQARVEAKEAADEAQAATEAQDAAEVTAP